MIDNTNTRVETTPSDLAAVGEGIISRLSTILEHKISVTNVAGNIVADSDLANFDKFVPSSVAAIQKGSSIPLPPDEIDHLSGWIIPLKHKDRTYGTLIIRNEPTPSFDVTSLAKSLAELLIYQMLVMDKIVHENRVLDKFFYDLFEKDEPKEKLLRESMFFNSQFFQIDFSEPRVSAVLVMKNFWTDVLKNQPILPADEHKLTGIKDEIREKLEKNLGAKNVIVTYLGADEFAILLPHKPAGDKDPKKKSSGNDNKPNYTFSEDQLSSLVQTLGEKFNRPVYMGIGQYYPEIMGLIQSYKGAKQAVRLGIKLMPKQQVFYHSEMLLPIILEQADEDLKKQFVENELGVLIRQQDLIETLSTHFNSNLNLKKTAYELGIHKNTLYYRLAKIKKMLNVDPQEFGTAIRLKIALYLWQMQKENSE